MSSVVETPTTGDVPSGNLESLDPKLAFDNLPVTAPAQRPRFEGLSAGLSIGVHVLAILGIIVVPLLLDAPLPGQQLETRAFFASPLDLAPPPPPPPPPPARTEARPRSSSSARPTQFFAPAATPVETIPESALDLGLDGGVPGGVEGGVPGGVVGGVIAGLPDAPAPPAAKPVWVGGAVKEPRKLKDVRPVYPDIAVQARVQGVVILECVIDPTGRVVDAKVLRGNPILDDAAVAAVEQWVYTPTLLNGQPVSIMMTVTVQFRISES
jgi:protein TonB